MADRARSAVAPAYLFACLVLGGSAQGVWQNMLLQLAAIAIIAWAAASRREQPLTPAARHLSLIVGVGIAVVALQLVPLPVALWSSIGPRHALAQGYAALGLSVPALPLSVAPAKSLNSLLGLLPPLAIYCAIVRLETYRPLWLAIALLAGALAGILIGTLQVVTLTDTAAPWYLYPETNFGVAVGFFANANHMATLLVISLPFLAAIAAAGRRSSPQRFSAVLALTIGAGLLILVGIALNGSLAGFGMLLPVLAASALILLPPHSRLRLWALVLSMVLLVGCIGALASSSTASNLLSREASVSTQSRAEMLSTTSRAIGDFLPWGSGLGSFVSVYHLYERPDAVTNVYVPHAHDDYIELALELGAAGIALMLIFLGWWAAAVWRVWRTAEPAPFVRAASIASAAILVHSIVDFPLRTAAIAAAFAMCLGLLSARRPAAPVSSSDLRPARHVIIR